MRHTLQKTCDRAQRLFCARPAIQLGEPISEKVSITVFPNGPIKVSAAKSIKFCGEQLSIATEPGDTGFDADINIVEGGEVRVQCAFEINENLLERQHENRATLCRCGPSKNKPWCDGRHKALKDFR